MEGVGEETKKLTRPENAPKETAFLIKNAGLSLPIQL